MRTLLALALLTSSAHAALMTSPQPAPDWLHVRLTPLTSWRAATRVMFAPGEIDYTGYPLPNGGLSYIGFSALYYDQSELPRSEQFWILKATDNIVGTIARNVGFGTFAEHDFAPEIAAGLDTLTVTLGAYNPVTGYRAYSYTGDGYLRNVRLRTEHATGVVPEPRGVVMLLGLGILGIAGRCWTRHALATYSGQRNQ